MMEATRVNTEVAAMGMEVHLFLNSKLAATLAMKMIRQAMARPSEVPCVEEVSTLLAPYLRSSHAF